MPTVRQLFLEHVAQTSRLPLMLDIDRAEGLYIYDTAGKRYMDLNSGICVSSLGHCHPDVVRAVTEQVGRYMHTMVYGEHIQQPQVALAAEIARQTAGELSSVYFVNSGTEAVEGAMKLARRSTGRFEIIAARNSYHGSTMGAESLRSDEATTMPYRPLVPGIRHIDYNSFDDLDKITAATAAVVLEPVQAEAGVIVPVDSYLEAVKERCIETGALLVLDEIQTGFGRTGALFAHSKHDIIPDIMTIGKAMGGGMPIAAFVSSGPLMAQLAHKPALGHITTFGGHPVTCAASLACMRTLSTSNLIEEVAAKSELFGQLLIHPAIREVRRSGLMMAVELTKKRLLKYVVEHIIDQGALVDYFLFNQESFRLAPPLIITHEEIKQACNIIREACDNALEKTRK